MQQLPNPTREELAVARMEADVAYFEAVGNEHGAEKARQRLDHYLAKLDAKR